MPLPDKLVSVDLATTTGWAFFAEGSLDSFGQIDGHSVSSADPPFDAIDKVRFVAERVASKVLSFSPNIIAIEATNIGGRAGQSSQRFLEWAHFALLSKLDEQGYRRAVRYVQSVQWRKAISLGLTDADKAQNRKLSVARSKLRARLGRKPTPAELSEAKIAVGIVGKRTIKHASVDWCNQRHHLNLKKTQADAADAICLGEAFLILNP